MIGLCNVSKGFTPCENPLGQSVSARYICYIENTFAGSL